MSHPISDKDRSGVELPSSDKDPASKTPTSSNSIPGHHVTSSTSSTDSTGTDSNIHPLSEQQTNIIFRIFQYLADLFSHFFDEASSSGYKATPVKEKDFSATADPVSVSRSSHTNVTRDRGHEIAERHLKDSPVIATFPHSGTDIEQLTYLLTQRTQHPEALAYLKELTKSRFNQENLNCLLEIDDHIRSANPNTPEGRKTIQDFCDQFIEIPQDEGETIDRFEFSDAPIAVNISSKEKNQLKQAIQDLNQLEIREGEEKIAEEQRSTIIQNFKDTLEDTRAAVLQLCGQDISKDLKGLIDLAVRLPK